MDMLHNIRSVTTDLPASQALGYLLKDRFPGEAVVTASLRSPSVVVLKMVSDIDPATPVIFCHPKPVFPESEAYRGVLVDLFGLSNVKVVTQSDPMTGKRDYERCEWLTNGSQANGGGIREALHLNTTLLAYKCWIKAAYHERPAGAPGQRIDVYGGMVIVNLLARRTTQAIDRFMKDHALPYHPKISHRKQRESVAEPDETELGYHF